jgi:dynein heavy chain, axonemal
VLQLTGKEFDMNPDTFTLGSMFALRLDQFADDVTAIVAAAEKELTIERELRKVADVWREQALPLVPYAGPAGAAATPGAANSGPQGWVMRSVDEITLLLEDMGLNLQSMMASPHVRPFVEEVRRWEARLGLIGECLEVWMEVQRKWMYLQSIFVGNEDIRHQLAQVRRTRCAAWHVLCGVAS